MNIQPPSMIRMANRQSATDIDDAVKVNNARKIVDQVYDRYQALGADLAALDNTEADCNQQPDHVVITRAPQ
ncbi:hypothetical protein IV102_12125 [bacterium]|nr:hypothetical protein [bacterium]